MNSPSGGAEIDKDSPLMSSRTGGSMTTDWPVAPSATESLSSSSSSSYSKNPTNRGPAFAQGYGEAGEEENEDEPIVVRISQIL
jgi:hypothetical protein